MGQIFASILVWTMAIIALPFLLLFLVYNLLMTPIFYIKYKCSRYQQDFPYKYIWPLNLHRDNDAYTAIKDNGLPVEYIKWREEYELNGYFVYRDTLLVFDEPFFFDKEKGLWLCWLKGYEEGVSEEDETDDETDADNADDCLTVEATSEYLLETFRRNVLGRECGRVVFFYSRKKVEKNYEKGGLEKMRQLDDFVVYEKGELANAIREFIEERR